MKIERTKIENSNMLTTAVETPAETQAKPSTEQILEETWLRENYLLSPDDVDRECLKSEFSSNSGVSQDSYPGVPLPC